MSKTTFTLKRKQFGFIGNMFGAKNWNNLKQTGTAVNLATKKEVGVNAQGKVLSGGYKAGQIAAGGAKALGSTALIAGGLAIGTGLAAKGVVNKASEQSDGSKMFSQVKNNDMATTYTLKRKVFSLGLNGEVLTPEQKLAEMKKLTGAKNVSDMTKKRGNNAVVFNRSTQRAINNKRTEIANTNRAYAEFRGNTAGIKGIQRAQGGIGQKVYEAGKLAGQNSTGVLQGMKNSWGRMGTLGKAGVIGAGVAATGLMAKGLFGGKNKEQQQ